MTNKQFSAHLQKAQLCISRSSSKKANFRWVFSIAKYLLSQFTSWYFFWQTWSYPDNLLSAVTFWPITFCVTDYAEQPVGTVGGIFKRMLAPDSCSSDPDAAWTGWAVIATASSRRGKIYITSYSSTRSLHFLLRDLGCTWTYHSNASDYRNFYLLLDKCGVNSRGGATSMQAKWIKLGSR